jgi:hypothetical protein
VIGSLLPAPGTRIAPRVSEFLERCKWLAFGLMLWNHINIFVLGRPDVMPAWFLGGLVFPLFVLSFSAVLHNRCSEDIKRIASRLFLATLVCFALQLLVRPGVPVNVLLTFSMAAFAFADYVENGPTWRILAFAAVSTFGEYSFVGFFLLFFSLVAFRTRDITAALAALAFVLPLSFFMHLQFGQFLLVLVLPLLWYLPVRIPRIKNWFLNAYVLQYPLLWVGAKVMGAGL